MKTSIKVGVLGANGQVGAELCLLLSRVAGLEIIPICRTRSGSAFLRWKGLRCRHGRFTDSAEAPNLAGDCDVIINSALASGTPAEIRRSEDALIRNSFQYSRPGAVIIYLSTQTVYGDPTPGRIRWRSAYGSVKLLSERTVRRCARRYGKAGYIFRLGHVGGALQNISCTIRNNISSGSLYLPADDRPSNMVYTVTIIEAIQRAISGGFPAGTYDLMNVPQWSWHQVHAYEAQRLGASPQITYVADESHASILRRGARALQYPALQLATSPFAHQQGSRLIAMLSPALNRRTQAWWNLRRARAQISALNVRPQVDAHLFFVANGEWFPPGLSATAVLLAASPYAQLDTLPFKPWPEDLPNATNPARVSSVVDLVPDVDQI